MDGKLDDWRMPTGRTIDKRSRAAVCVSGERLYVAYHIDYDYRLENSPDRWITSSRADRLWT